MTPPKKNNIPGDKLERYDKLVRTNPKIERRGAANPYTSLNGHMFTVPESIRFAGPPASPG